MYDHPLSYSPFRDGELLFLAARMNSLLPDAQSALVAELRRRGLDSTVTSNTVTSNLERRSRVVSIASRVEISRVRQ